MKSLRRFGIPCIYPLGIATYTYIHDSHGPYSNIPLEYDCAQARLTNLPWLLGMIQDHLHVSFFLTRGKSTT